jgi:hypothetical protein
MSKVEKQIVVGKRKSKALAEKLRSLGARKVIRKYRGRYWQGGKEGYEVIAQWPQNSRLRK